jgi:signal transduction histidine kinase
VFQNLITNAIKFMKKHAKPKIEIGAEQIKDRWRFSIRDNGIGIAANSFDRVFDIFQRLHTSKTYEGSGIGLANCKKIIQLHGGDIGIESTLGKGTTFYFDIPILTK